MADPALNPRNPNDAADGTPAGDTDAPPPGGTEPEELDLEAQVDALLSEVSETVEQISKRLDHESKPDNDGPLAGDSAITDDGATDVVEDAAEPDAGEPDASMDQPDRDDLDAELAALTDAEDVEGEPEPADAPAPDADTPPDHTDADAIEAELAALTEADDIEGETEPAEAAAADTPPDHTDTDAIEAELAALAEADDVSGEAAAEETPAPAADAPITPESVQAELDAALDGLGEGDDAAPPAPEPDPPAPVDTDADPDALAAAADSLLKAPDDEQTGDADPGAADYTDANALDDELAALAGGDDEFEGQIEHVEGPPLPAPPTATDPAEADPDGDAAPDPDTEPDAGPAQASPEPAEEPAPEPVGAAPRWGWLPPKPDWPEAFGRARPLVIAWRHAAWIVPPFLAFVWAHVWAHTKRGAIAAEPRVRHATAVIAAPLSRRDERTRSLIGYLSVWTLFWSACVWVWVLIGRSPVVPEPAVPPAGLQGNATTEIAAD